MPPSNHNILAEIDAAVIWPPDEDVAARWQKSARPAPGGSTALSIEA
jgi:hypothetical protein